MADKTGVARLRQAIENQTTCGSGQFELSFDSADKLCREIEDELAQMSWAKDVPAPLDTDGKLVLLRTEVLYTDEGEEFSVGGFSYLRDEKAWAARGVRKHSERLCVVGLRRLHLTKPDSWEKLEKDVSKAGDEDICGYFGFAMSRPCRAECPARDAHDSCAVIAVRDVMRRAKALAEHDEKASTPQTSSHEAKETDRD